VDAILSGVNTGALFVREGVEHVEGSGHDAEARDIENQDRLPDRVNFIQDMRTEKTAVRYPNHYPVLLRYKEPEKYKKPVH
jgi:hypothetical protein